MGTISYFDIWKTYENETMNDEDLLRFAKGLFQEGFIRVSTVYDEELDKKLEHAKEMEEFYSNLVEKLKEVL